MGQKGQKDILVSLHTFVTQDVTDLHYSDSPGLKDDEMLRDGVFCDNLRPSLPVGDWTKEDWKLVSDEVQVMVYWDTNVEKTKARCSRDDAPTAAENVDCGRSLSEHCTFMIK